MSTPHRIDASSVRVIEQGGPFGEGVPDYARRQIAALADCTSRPILFGRVRLTQHIEPTAVIVKGLVDVDGDVILAKAHAFSAREAIDLVIDALRKQLAERSSGNRTEVRHVRGHRG
jgi:ribosome-associated translation inhibitor RaiA